MNASQYLDMPRLRQLVRVPAGSSDTKEVLPQRITRLVPFFGASTAGITACTMDVVQLVGSAILFIYQ